MKYKSPLLYGLVASIALICLTFIFTPYFIPQKTVTQLLEKKLNAKVEIKTISFSLFGPQIFDEIVLKSDSLDLNIEKMEIQKSFWGLLFFPEESYFLIKSPKLTKFIPQESKEEGSFFLPPIRLELIDGTIDIPLINAEKLYLKFFPIFNEQTVYTTISGEVLLQERSGTFQGSCKSTLSKELFELLKKGDPISYRTWAKGLLGEAHLLIDHAPLNEKDPLFYIFGQHIDLKLDIKNDGLLNLNYNLNTPLIQSNAYLTTDFDTTNFLSPLNLDITLIPALFSYYQSPLNLLEPFKLQIVSKDPESVDITMKKPSNQTAVTFISKEKDRLQISDIAGHIEQKVGIISIDLLQNDQKGSLVLRLDQDNKLTFKGNDLLTRWALLSPSIDWILLLGNSCSFSLDLQQNLQLYEGNCSFYSENLSFEQLSFAHQAPFFELTKQTLIHSKWLDLHLNTFAMHQDEVLQCDLIGQGPFVDFEYNGYAFKGSIESIILKKESKEEAYQGKFRANYTNLQGPNTDYLGNKGALSFDCKIFDDTLFCDPLTFKSNKIELLTATKISYPFNTIDFTRAINAKVHFLSTGEAELLLAPFELPFDLGRLDLEGSLLFNPYDVNEELTIDKGSAKFHYEKEADLQRIRGSFQGIFDSKKNETGSLTATFDVAKKENGDLYYDISSQGYHLPVLLFSAEYVDLLGPIIDMTLYLTKNQEEETIRLDAKNELVNASCHLKVDNGLITLFSLNEPLFIKLNLNPTIHNAFLNQYGYELKHPGFVEIEIPILQTTYPFSFEKTQYQATVQGEAISLIDMNSSARYGLESFKSSSSKNQETLIDLKINAASNFCSNSRSKERRGNMELHALFDYPLNKSLLVEGQFETFPTFMFMEYLGPTMNGQFEINTDNKNGPCKAFIQAENLHISMDGMIKDGQLYLIEPLRGKFQEINFKSIATVAGEWIEFYFDPKGFTFPLLPFDVSKISIPKAFVSPLHLQVQPTPNINALLTILEAKSSESKVPLYIVPPCSEFKNRPLNDRPITFSLINGTLSIERIDMLLARNYWLALWGRVNLFNSQAVLYLGLTAPTLQSTFQIQHLNPSFVLPFKIAGSLDALKIDKKDALLKIATLAQKMAQGNKSGPKSPLDFATDMILNQKGVPALICPPSFANQF